MLRPSLRLPRIVARALTLRRLLPPVEPMRLRPSRFARAERVDTALSGAVFLETVDRHVQLGASPRGAIQSAADNADPALTDTLRVLLLHCRTGAPLDDEEVLVDAAGRNDDEAFLVRSLVAAGAGGRAASYALQRASWALRERHAIRAERRTHAAQAVFAARILSWLPVIFGVMMAATNDSVRSAYFGGPVGIFCVAVGVALNVAGRRWMKRITCSFA